MQKHPVSGARHEIQAGAPQRRPIAGQGLDLEPQPVAAVGEEDGRFAQTAEHGGLIENPAPAPVAGRSHR